MVILRQLLSRKWLLTTLLAIAAVVVLIRLGNWQLDRLEQRRIFNSRVTAQIDSPPIELNAGTISLDLYNMEYRSVNIIGEYDHSFEVALNNQVWGGLLGIHLLTPLKITGTDSYILVDRGWIPQEDYSPERWSKYAAPGIVTLQGVIRRPRSNPTFGGIPDPALEPGEKRLLYWNMINLDRIQIESELLFLPVYVLQSPDGEQLNPPLKELIGLDLTEGSHIGYALQWFAFAVILAIGYPIYVRSQTRIEEMSHQVDESKL